MTAARARVAPPGGRSSRARKRAVRSKHTVAPSRLTARARSRKPKLRVAEAPQHRRLPFFLVSLVVVGLLIAGVAGLQAVVSQNSFRMDDLSHRTVQLQQRYGELQLQVAEMSSPKQLARAAKRLGMQLPGSVHVLTVRGATATERPALSGQPSFALKGELQGSR